ncbi:MAG: TROVE domain-containing protein [Candidatus Promineifilaceae bacterium]|nr:TROVE domain-containing protein [Chloroflexota bacterium]
MTKLRHLFSIRETPQYEPIPGTAQVANSAGGYAWAVNDWARLDRFLVLGSEGGTCYISPRQLTKENAAAALRCLALDGQRVVNRVVSISEAGRAPSNDPALFVLALAAGHGDEATRRAALDALPQVARIGTHLFHFLAFVEGFRGWGRGLRRAVANWYTAMPAAKLAYQAIKYRQRDGWTHRDALRLAHPQAEGETQNALLHWMARGWPDVGPEPHPDEVLRLIWAYEQAQRATDEAQVIELVRQYNLPWEALPTQFLASAQVWDALLPHLPLTALVRNLGRMTANGLLMPLSDAAATVVSRLQNAEHLLQARVHPIAVLTALMTYAQGQGMRGKLSWMPVPAVLDALDKAFYLSFANVEATGKRVVLALDVSGSMAMSSIGQVPGLTPRVAAAAMALITAATEERHTIIAFSQKMMKLNISSRQRLDNVVKATSDLPFMGTDCALPMLWALENKVKADAFIIYTDSETWAGNIHPTQALREYRQKMGRPAKLIVVGMVSNGFSIADPDDAGMLDVVGFDAAAPQLMADFIKQGF